MAVKNLKKVGGKAAATRNEFTGVAVALVAAQTNKDKASAGQLTQALKAAELTDNNEAMRTKLRDALQAAYAKAGCPIKTARVYVSECMRITKAYFLSVPFENIQNKETGKPVMRSGKQQFQNVSYDTAKRVASSILSYHGLKSTKGVKAGKAKAKAAAKPLDKAGIIQLLDQVIAQVRVNSGFNAKVLTGLIAARHDATGSNPIKVIGPVVTISRGQKAAATRRANEEAQDRTIARQSNTHKVQPATMVQ